jgi:hypothetical protein
VARAAALSARVAALSVQRAPALSAKEAAAPSKQPSSSPSALHTLAPSTQRAPASSVHSVVGGSIDLHRESSATSPIKNVAPQKNNKSPRVSLADLVIFLI